MVDGSLPALFNSLAPSWQEVLSIYRVEIDRIESHLRPGTYNPEGNVFAALRVNPDQISVVLIGQDPYPNKEFANGLAFAIPPHSKKIPPSLRNIMLEIQNDLGRDTSLERICSWPDQGVLMLNTHLTCETGKPLSHQKLGWMKITEGIINAASAKNPVAILWGAHAQKFSHYFSEESILSSAHPSPLSAYRGFFGSKPFSKTNAILQSRDIPSINW